MGFRFNKFYEDDVVIPKSDLKKHIKRERCVKKISTTADSIQHTLLKLSNRDKQFLKSQDLKLREH